MLPPITPTILLLMIVTILKVMILIGIYQVVTILGTSLSSYISLFNLSNNPLSLVLSFIPTSWRKTRLRS